MGKMDVRTVSYTGGSLQGVLTVPGDKSISHRAIMLGSMAKGITTISGFLAGEDCLSTINIFRQLGVIIERNGSDVTINSPGIEGWRNPSSPLDAGNSGTTARLLLGILAGSPITAEITGDQYLLKRPMRRVTDPLTSMGAIFEPSSKSGNLPLTIKGAALTAIHYNMPVASAQVKSAILLAGLTAKGTTVLEEQVKTRDHTERMLTQFGASIDSKDLTISIEGGQSLEGARVNVPGDISSAAFFMCASAMVPGSSITFQGLGLNPTRMGIIDVLTEMGAHVTWNVQSTDTEEPYGEVTVKANTLQAIEIGGKLIPRLIDELPVIALLATQANGTTVIKDAQELRVKETDRIQAVCEELQKLGANIQATPDGMKIIGPTKLNGATLSSKGDHRLGMMAAIASYVSEEPILIEDAECINVSYPKFFEHMSSLT